MSGDILKQATRALRDETKPVRSRQADERAQQTRDQLMDKLSARKKSPIRTLRWLVPLAAIVLTSSAWASGRLDVAWSALFSSPELAPIEAKALGASAQRSLRQVVAVRRALLPVEPRPVAQADAEPPDDDPADDPTGDEPTDGDAAAASPASHAAQQSGRAGAPLKPRVAKPAPGERSAAVEADPSAAGDGDNAAPAAAANSAQSVSATLYRQAHRAHFGGAGPAKALALWDRYLSSSPTGRFVPEAQYNRALCLVRLGRQSAAIAALKPFANGAYGSYRKEEAERLIAAIEKK